MQVADIYREYAEHLYAKGDYEGAIEQYKHTVGELPPSTVIARYLGTQRVHDLTRYLDALHMHADAVGEGGSGRVGDENGSRGVAAGPEHTALLLQCYAKLNDTASLKRFVEWATRSPSPPALHASAAVEVLRACGYRALAVELAAASGETARLLQLLVEETNEVRRTALPHALRGVAYHAASHLTLAHAPKPLPCSACTCPCHAHAPHLHARAPRLLCIPHPRALSGCRAAHAQYDRALQLLHATPVREARGAMLKWGAELLAHRPPETTALLVHLSTGLEAEPPKSTPADPTARRKPPADALDPIAWLAKPQAEREAALDKEPSGGTAAAAAAAASAAVSAAASALGVNATGRPAAAADAPAEKLAESSAVSLNAFIRLFSRRRRSLLTYLEALIESGLEAATPPPPVVADTLMQLYLTKREPTDEPPLPRQAAPTAGRAADGAPELTRAHPADGAPELAPELAALSSAHGPPAAASEPIGAVKRRERAFALLRRAGVKLSDEHALLLSFEHDWPQGRATLFEKLGRTEELMRHHAAQRDSHAVMRTCRRHGEANPQMWLMALRHLVDVAPEGRDSGGQAGEGGDADERSWRAQITEVINVIEADKLLTPMELLQLVSGAGDGGGGGGGGHGSGSGGGRIGGGSRVPLGVISGVLERQLRTLDATLTEQRREASRFEEDSARMRAEIAEIDSGGRTFQLSKCSSCHGPLELPSVHFHCMHSYHLACLGDNDQECPTCAPQRRRVAEHQLQQRALARNHDEFFHALEAASDGFATVSEFIGRGMLCDVESR